MPGTKTLDSWPSPSLLRGQEPCLAPPSACWLAMQPNPPSPTICRAHHRHVGASLWWHSLYWRDIWSSCEIMAEPPCLTSKSLSHPAHQIHCVSRCLPVRWQVFHYCEMKVFHSGEMGCGRESVASPPLPPSSMTQESYITSEPQFPQLGNMG